MPLGRVSSEKLALAHPALQRLVVEVARCVDHGILAPLVLDTCVICSFRNQADQDKAFRTGTSKKRWPDSGHNRMPALAVDFLPYPLDWARWERDASPLWLLQGYTRAVAERMGIPLKPAISWDAPHYELKQMEGA